MNYSSALRQPQHVQITTSDGAAATPLEKLQVARFMIGDLELRMANSQHLENAENFYRVAAIRDLVDQTIAQIEQEAR